MFLGKVSEVPVAPAYMFSWLLGILPQSTWDESGFLSMGPGGCAAAIPRSTTPQGPCMAVFVVVAFHFLLAELLVLPLYELLKLSWMSSITSSGFKKSVIFRREIPVSSEMSELS